MRYQRVSSRLLSTKRNSHLQQVSQTLAGLIHTLEAYLPFHSLWRENLATRANVQSGDFHMGYSDKVCHEGVHLVADKKPGSSIDGFLNNIS